MIYLQLFFTFAQVGLFSLGGGYVALAVIQSKVVEGHPWLTMSQLADVIAISETTPGPVSINASTFVGYQMAGVPGALAATCGFLLLPFCITLLLAVLYKKYKEIPLVKGIVDGIRPAIVAVIATVAISMVVNAVLKSTDVGFMPGNIQWAAVAVFLVNLFLLRRFKFSQVYLLLLSGVVGILLYSPLIQ